MTTNTNEAIIAEPVNSTLMRFIFAKLWVKSQDGKNPGSIKISRDLPRDIVLKAGTTIALHDNNQRLDQGKQDADYSLSILLPRELAMELIEQEKALKAERAQRTETEIAS